MDTVLAEINEIIHQREVGLRPFVRLQRPSPALLCTLASDVLGSRGQRTARDIRIRFCATRHCCAQVIVSSPEEAQDGSGVMDRVMTLCDEFPAYFVQGFDWASSGNSYARDDPLWAEFKVVSAAPHTT